MGSRARRAVVAAGLAIVVIVGTVATLLVLRCARPAPTTYQGRTLPEWREALRDPDPATRIRACEVIQEASDQLTQAMARGGADTLHGLAEYRVLRKAQNEASAVLKEMARTGVPVLAEATVPELIKKLRGGGDLTRVSAASKLGGMGPAARDAIPDLMQVMKEGRREAHVAAAAALLQIDPTEKEAITFFIKTLRHEDSIMRGLAAETLGSVGPAAKDAVRALTEALKDEDEFVREAATEALKKIQEME